MPEICCSQWRMSFSSYSTEQGLSETHRLPGMQLYVCNAQPFTSLSSSERSSASSLSTSDIVMHTGKLQQRGAKGVTCITICM